MADEDDGVVVKRARRHVHYGSLEASISGGGGSGSPSVFAGPSSSSSSNSNNTASNSITVTHSGPNIHTSRQYYEISPESGGIQAVERQSQLDAFELRKKARSIPVSTDDVVVRAHLRNFNHPMCLFGEDPADRRERLRQLMARMGVDALRQMKGEEEGGKSSAADQEKAEAANKTWYHEGSEALLKTRYALATFSLPRAAERLEEARRYRDLPLEVREGTTQELYKRLRTLEIGCSQVGDQRPVSSVSFSPDGQLIATSSWSGLCKLWAVPSLEHRRTLRAHNVNADKVAWHPQATLTQEPTAVNLASCAVDGSVHLWALEEEAGGGASEGEPLHSLTGHAPHRVASVAFHPAGSLLATACYDHSWRLWDLGAGGGPEELLHQEGHSKGVHDVAFQADGSLAASAGRDSFGRVWDLRTGRCIMFMEGHLKGIISVDFSPNGYQLVTGSEDNTVKIWNIRQRKLEYTIAAHTNVVSKVKFDRHTAAAGGAFIASASYDATVKLWASPAWTPIKTLAGHDGKVMGVDMSSSGLIASCSFDRTFKLWEPTAAH